MYHPLEGTVDGSFIVGVGREVEVGVVVVCHVDCDEWFWVGGWKGGWVWRGRRGRARVIGGRSKETGRSD